MTMQLYGSKLSPFVMRPLLAARAKGHEMETDMFEGGIKGAAYLALSPIGKMPLLVDGDFVLPESQPITDYLDRVLSGPKLAPEDPKEAARTRLMVRIVDLYVVPHLAGLFQGRDKPDGVAPAIAGIAAGLGYIEHFRRDTDILVIGDAFTVADAALIPICFFFEAFDKTMGTGKLIADLPGLAAWWGRAKASDLGGRALAEQAAGLKAMMGG